MGCELKAVPEAHVTCAIHLLFADNTVCSREAVQYLCATLLNHHNCVADRGGLKLPVDAAVIESPRGDLYVLETRTMPVQGPV